jgi:CRISPR-associated endonuclease/helicase Cas3
MNLPPLDVSEFAAFFQAMHGVMPFPWQQRLAERLARDGWPEVLDLPTGSGKTAAIDVALFNLALQAELGERRGAPVRIAFVVDRRIIVDAAFDRADGIARALAAAEGEGPLARVAARLRHLAGPSAPPLLVQRLRGGLPREPDWARSPNQPTVLCSTVDQVGSRLLFRGYGVSDGMKPVHAGLLGDDCLFLLDEAHLASPFAETLGRIATYRAPPWCNTAPGPWGFVTLSATPDKPGAGFGLEEVDRTHPVLHARLHAAKPARLPKPERDAKDAGKFADIFADAASELLAAGANSRIAVVVNRVALARAVFERLAKSTGEAAETVLLTGRIRGLDRDALLKRILPRVALGAEASEGPLIMVATQTVEAGADFDFDALVTQAAPLDALRQRFGRLNRAGRAIQAQAIVIAAKDEVTSRADDPVYGTKIRETWTWLNGKATKPTGKAAPSVDFGIAAMESLLSGADATALSADKPQAPILRPTDLLLLSWTSPVPAVDPTISLFLHGPKSGPADISIVWRADISADTLPQAPAWVALVPPHAGETLDVPLWAARAWLSGEADRAGDVADVEGAAAVSEQRALDPRPALRWAGEDSDATRVISAADLRPGDVIVVPAEYGGCDEYGWNPVAKQTVIDLGDARGGGRRAIRRLHPGLPGWSEAVAFARPDDTIDDADRLDALGAKGWRIVRPDGYGDGLVLLAPGRDELAASTEDEASGQRAAKPVGLAQHTADVAALAASFAGACGLPPARVADIQLAALLHDAGKADPRFQSMLHGGDRLLAALAREPLAKSSQAPAPGAAKAARKAAGLPERWRHEAQSVTRAITDDRLGNAADPELVLWLIGTHHGYGRPLFPHHDPREADGALGPQRLDFLFRGFDWPQLFERLKARYGPWHLARLEAVLRLADHRASAFGDES